MVKRGFLLVVLLFSLFFISFSSADISSLRQGLVAYYPFDSGSLDDFSNNDVTASITGSNIAYTSSGIQGGAYDFSGTDGEYIGFPTTNMPVGNQNRTFVMWVKTTSSDGTSGLWAYGTGSSRQNSDVYLNYAGRGIAWELYDIDFWTGEVDYNDGDWNLLIFTHDNSTNTSRILMNDNTLLASNNEYLNTGTTNGVRIGARINGWAYDGILDEFAVWNRVLTDEEISDLYNTGNGLSLKAGFNINSPINGTYLNSSNLTINFTGIALDFIWYNNGTGNSSIFDATTGLVDYFNASDGQYNFTLYGNNSAGDLFSESLTFWIDTTNPRIEYGEGTEDNDAFFVRDWIYVNVSYDELYVGNVSFDLYDSEGILVSSSSYLDGSSSGFSQGLVGYWPLDSDSNDYSGNGNDGVEQGGVTSGVPGKIGEAYSLDGNDDYISVSDSSSLDISGEITLQAWLKLDTSYSCSGSAYPLIVGKNSDYTGYSLWLKDSSCTFTGGFSNWLWGETILNSPSRDIWYHYLISFDGSNAAAYVNGVNVMNISGDEIPLNDNSLIMGKHYSQNTFWKGYLDEVAIWNRSLSASEVSQLYNDGAGKSLLGYDFSNFTYVSNNFTGLDDGTYLYNVTIYDRAGNVNYTETRTITIDATAPSYSDLTYNPNDTVSLDPSENITLNVTISESLSEIDSIILYYNYTLWNGTSSDLIEVGNNSFSGDLNLANYSFVFETQNQNSTYSFYLFMNDTNGNSQNSTLSEFNSTWDCIWAINTTSDDGLDLGTIGGFNQEKILGNLTIYNYGDSEYHINNCTLQFGRNRTAFQIFDQGITSPSSTRLNFSSDYRNSDFSSFGESQGIRYYLEDVAVTSLTVNASENKTLSVKALFPILPSGFNVLEEVIFFPIEAVVGLNVTEVVESLSDIVEFLGSSSFVTHWGGSSSAIVRAKMVVTPGAYLDLLVEDEPSNEIIDLKEGQYYFTVSMKNVVETEDNSNNTAYDVYFNVTLPSEVSSLFTNTTYSEIFVPVANDTSKYYITVTMDLNSSNLASLSENNYTVKFFAYGYENSTGNLTLINHSSGQVLEESIYFEFRCPSQSYTGLKADICNPVSTPSSGGSGGGGGGGGAGTATIKTEATFELVRGEQTSFQLPITNTYPNPKKNITIKVKGVEEKYVSISPKIIDFISGNSSKNVTFTLTAPAYFSQNSSIIELEINGIVDSGNTTYPFKENKFVKLVILEFSKEQALKYLNASESYLNEMNKSGFIVEEISELYAGMQNYFSSYDYINLKNNYDLTEQIKTSAFESRDLIQELQEAIEKAENRGIEVLETKKLLFAAETLFERGEYISALEKLREAKSSFALETKGEFNILYEIKNNPLQYLALLFGFGLFGLGATIGVKYKYLKARIKLLGEEADLIVQLMKVVQKECFEYGKMHMDEYQLAMAQYEKRLTETIEDRISAETKLAYLGQLHSELSSLTQEKKRIIGLMQGLQENYLKKGQMETRLYEGMMKIYSQRLSKVDEQLALIEAKEFLKKNK